MRKTVLSMTMTTLSILVLAGGALAGEDAWFDMDNCSMCKHLMTDPAQMENIGWEHHLTASGMLSVSTFRTKESRDYFAKVAAKMEKVGQKLMAGEQMHMCNFCKSYGALMMTGKVNIEEFDTETGNVMLITSADPTTVEMIHKHGQKTIDEYAKVAMDEHGDDHHGHSHEGHEHNH